MVVALALPPPTASIEDGFAAPTVGHIFIWDQYNQLMALLHRPSEDSNITSTVNLAGTSNLSSSPIWFVDSGATHHVCSDLKYFPSYHQL